MHTASYHRKKAVILMLMRVCFPQHGHKCCCFHKWKELALFQADAQYKALEGEHIPHQQIQRVNSMHRTELKGVKIGSCASKRHKLFIIGRPAEQCRVQQQLHCEYNPYNKLTFSDVKIFPTCKGSMCTWTDREIRSVRQQFLCHCVSVIHNKLSFPDVYHSHMHLQTERE